MPSSPDPSCVVFDFGGVLITPITTLLAEIATWHDVSMLAMLEVLMGPREVSTLDHPWHRCERGEMALAGLQEAIVPWAVRAGLTLRGDEYDRLLCAEFDVHHEVVARIEQLRHAGYTVGLLTNSFVEFRPVLEAAVDFSLFDLVVDSSEVGTRKPEPAIYELTTQRLDTSADRILYLDDFPGNVAGAAAAGWRTIHVTDRDRILPDLDAALAGDLGRDRADDARRASPTQVG